MTCNTCLSGGKRRRKNRTRRRRKYRGGDESIAQPATSISEKTKNAASNAVNNVTNMVSGLFNSTPTQSGGKRKRRTRRKRKFTLFNIF